MKVLKVRKLKYYTLYDNVSEYQLLEELGLPDPDDCLTFEESYERHCENVRVILAHYRTKGFTHIHDETANSLAVL